MTRATVLIAVFAALPACKKKDDEAAGAVKVPPPPGVLTNPGTSLVLDAAPAPLRLEAREVTIAGPARQATLAVKVPVGWAETGAGSGTFRAPTATPGVDTPAIHVGFGALACKGACDDAEVRASLDASMAALPGTWARPNQGTGRPELDDVRLDVAELERDDLAGGGKMLALKVTRPAGLTGPYPELLVATCARARAGDAFTVVTEVRAPVAAEGGPLWALLVEACAATAVK